jgi:phage portal protein BeeE
MLFVQARFVFRRWIDGEPQKPFTNPDLDLLNVRPWDGGTTSDLLMRLLQHGDFAGTGFVVNRTIRGRAELRVPRPDWMTILLGSEDDPEVDSRDIDATIIGFLYHPGGRYSGRDPVPLLPSQVAHFIPTTDPLFRFWGIPWLMPVIKNVQGHDAATEHKLRFFENGATPQVIVTLGEKAADPEKFKAWIDVFEQEHAGPRNAYRTIYMAAGANAEVVGANLRQLDMRNVQNIDELTIANAGGVPATVVGLSEGLQGSSLNAGNFGQSMRRFANLTIRPLWGNAAGSLQRIIRTSGGAELWYADKHIPALQEDIKDQAEVVGIKASAIRTLGDGGWDKDAVVRAIDAGDLSLLEGNDTGLVPVQLQPPGADGDGDGAARLAPPVRAFLTDGQIRCPGCGQMHAKRDSGQFYGDTEHKCRRCGLIAVS